MKMFRPFGKSRLQWECSRTDFVQLEWTTVWGGMADYLGFREAVPLLYAGRSTWVSSDEQDSPFHPF